MKKYLTVSIDVEPDCSPNWTYSDPLEFRGVSIGVAGRLQPLFNEFGITPTYLINNVVLEDKESVGVFRQLPGKYELGTHLHPEFIAPDKKFDVYAGKSGRANCCFYPPEVESGKIQSITQLFQANFGYKPTSFRAGRFSAGCNTITSLSRLGYLVDTSVTPHLCWNDASRERPVDFTDAPEQPYFMSEQDITREDTRGRILQVPVSIALKKRSLVREFISAAGGWRHAMRKNKPVWLRPFYSQAPAMIDIARQYGSAYQHKPQLVLNMMFHNVETLPGLSPYTRTEKACAEYLEQLRIFFDFCRREDIVSVGLSDLYKICR